MCVEVKAPCGAKIAPVEPCVACGCTCPVCCRYVVMRPKLPLDAGRSDVDVARVEAWLARVPERARFCQDCVHEAFPHPVFARIDPRIGKQASARLFFTAFGHPTAGRRPAKRTPLAGAVLYGEGTNAKRRLGLKRAKRLSVLAKAARRRMRRNRARALGWAHAVSCWARGRAASLWSPATTPTRADGVAKEARGAAGM